MRKVLLLVFLGVALAIGALFPFTRSNAKLAPKERNTGLKRSLGGSSPKSNPLPDFDIRLAQTGEFQDYDLNSATGKQSAAQRVETSALASTKRSATS
jgi:hypothetical protein